MKRERRAFGQGKSLERQFRGQNRPSKPQKQPDLEANCFRVSNLIRSDPGGKSRGHRCCENNHLRQEPVLPETDLTHNKPALAVIQFHSAYGNYRGCAVFASDGEILQVHDSQIRETVCRNRNAARLTHVTAWSVTCSFGTCL